MRAGNTIYQSIFPFVQLHFRRRQFQLIYQLPRFSFSRSSLVLPAHTVKFRTISISTHSDLNSSEHSSAFNFIHHQSRFTIRSVTRTMRVNLKIENCNYDNLERIHLFGALSQSNETVIETKYSLLIIVCLFVQQFRIERNQFEKGFGRCVIVALLVRQIRLRNFIHTSQYIGHERRN